MRLRIGSISGSTAFRFDSAARVFEDTEAASCVERVVDGQERWHTIGLAGGIVLLSVAHTVEEDDGEETAGPRERAVYDSLD
jgi:uncharacterized DUF497 family protein